MSRSIPDTTDTPIWQALKHAPAEVYLIDALTLCCIDASDGARRVLGYAADELRRLTLPELCADLTRELLLAHIDSLQQGIRERLTVQSQLRRRDGGLYPIEAQWYYVATWTPPVLLIVVQDTGERQRYVEALERKTLYDPLTGLPNRGLLLDRMQHAIRTSRRASAPLGVFIIDVVRLKEVNDILGHASGDRVLTEVAARLQQVVRESDTVCRLGGDEFCIVTTGTDATLAVVAAKRMQEIFSAPFVVDGTTLDVETAIGVAIYPDHGDDPAKLLQHADIAMRAAKNAADGFNIYDPDDDPFSLRRLRLHGELRQAIHERKLLLHYQPKIEIRSRRVTGVEALARWPHPEEGMVAPVDFVPMIEQSGMIRPFTRWVLDEALGQCRAWTDAGVAMTVAVNLSTRNLLDPALPDNVLQLLKGYDLAPDRLVLEVTESAVMSRPDAALKVLQRLKDMGVRLSIDDFGTGYSSLAYLKRLPVHELKIDASFVSDIVRNDSDMVIVRSTIDLAQNMGLQVVAEGVETQSVLDVLAALRCDVAQGYYFSKPLAAEAFDHWLADSPWRPE